MKKMKVITIAAALTLSATMAFAGPHGGDKGFGGGKGRGHRGGFMSQRLAEKLNLTDAQKSQIQAIQKGFRENNAQAFENAKVLRQQVREARQANDTARLESLKPAMEAQRTQFQQLREAQKQQILAVLTAEQRAQLEALKAERKQRRGGQQQ
ncbi:MAG TPA: Spy/CpxP family protein refolding chaperone [Thermoanaerobaculia bacterium]|nr:Spy/CpxP family protein refolding chaperone [Thermoanaerobaculia bacterium]